MLMPERFLVITSIKKRIECLAFVNNTVPLGSLKPVNPQSHDPRTDPLLATIFCSVQNNLKASKRTFCARLFKKISQEGTAKC